MVAFLTVTAPGADVLPWDRTHCAPLGDHDCSGALGCRVEQEAARDWNRTAPDRWRRLHRRAYQSADLKPWMLARVWEHHRGVLHIHPVFAFGNPRTKAAVHKYARRLRELAPQYGFGFVDLRFQVMPGRRAAAYLSAYFVTGKKNKLTLQQSVTSRAMPRSIVHVSNRLTRETGVTMRELRFRRYVWMIAERGGCELAEARAIAEAHRAGTLDLTLDQYLPSPRLIAQILGIDRGGPTLQGAIPRPAPATA